MPTNLYNTTASVLYLAFYISGIVYRLFFHPLSRYLGSKLAIANPKWYKLYRNFHHRGRFICEIEQLRRRHGPIVRISANDLHINDPEIYLEITRIVSRFRKDARFYDRTLFRDTSLGSLDPHAHRERHRVLVNAAFSSSRVKELAWIIEEKVRKLLDRFERSREAMEPVNVHKGCKALTMDIIAHIALSQDLGCIQHPEFRDPILEKLHLIFEEMSWIAKILFTVTRVSLSIPPWVFKFVYTPAIIMMKELVSPMVVDYLHKRDEPSEQVPAQ